MKENISKKAGEMFLSLGFKSVTIHDIAFEMGISPKIISAYFESKQSLIEAAVLQLTAPKANPSY